MGASDGARRAVPLNHDPSETIAAPQTIPIHSSQWNIVSRLAKDDSNIAVTSRTFAGEVFYHGRFILQFFEFSDNFWIGLRSVVPRERIHPFF